ncbi:MAG: hypothetical protein ACD_71C00010G0004 [uncultured bacterium (gcode 4)]|uniref:Uncharacterized protein n=1 Tax=uncultured bacterium (gcode 4) TaxID=1234023 RepID=K1Z5I5_9BACT|nr:MAG: hypothetical protein ACD_71C00010G0004 [uncultured bacterium (gcode 4)]
MNNTAIVSDYLSGSNFSFWKRRFGNIMRLNFNNFLFLCAMK